MRKGGKAGGEKLLKALIIKVGGQFLGVLEGVFLWLEPEFAE